MKLPKKLINKILKGELDISKTYTTYKLTALTYDKDDKLIHRCTQIEHGDVVVNYEEGNLIIEIHPWIEIDYV